MLIALRKKMRANESAMTSETPAPRIATGAISRDEPHPKFEPPTRMYPLPDLRGPGVAAGHAFHRVLAELLLVEGVDRVLGRDDLVGVDVVAELPSAPTHDFGQRHSCLSASPGFAG